jgi:hypothetical protein
MRAVVIALISVCTFTAGAEAPTPQLLFGPEFTFGVFQGKTWSGMGGSAPARDALIERMTAHLIGGQPKNARFQQTESREFISPNSWRVEVDADYGVVEVTMDPLTVEQMKRYANDIQDALFVSAANVDLYPALFAGGGHINIGLNAFAQHPLLLRNFIVDLYNHSELFMGVFSYDTNNALPFALYEDDTKEKIAELIDAYDHGHVQTFNLMEKLNAIQSESRDVFRRLWNGTDDQRYKMVAVNFGRIGYLGRKSRIELRGVRAQASYHVWIKQCELLQKRLEFLDTLDYPIALKPAVNLVEPLEVMVHRHGLNPPVNPQEALAAFHRYVVESGARWDDQREYLWPAWLSSGAVDRYESSPQFQKVQHTQCQHALLKRSA